eukprot:2514515-Amphidinium_carterae.1
MTLPDAGPDEHYTHLPRLCMPLPDSWQGNALCYTDDRKCNTQGRRHCPMTLDEPQMLIFGTLRYYLHTTSRRAIPRIGST